MKKLTRKLLLSVFSLGLAVVTLSTTTFAWYTANTEVSATAITGAAKGESDGSLEIKTATSAWKPTVAFGSGDYTTNGQLIPLQNNNGTLTTLGAGAHGGAYIQFTIQVRKSVKDGVATPVYLKNITVANNSSLPVKNILSTAGNLGALAGEYTMDIRRALSFSVTSSGGVNPVTHQNYSLGEYLGNFGDSYTADVNAHEYYADVMRESLSLDADYEKAINHVTAGTITDATKDTAVRVCTLPEEEGDGNGTAVSVTFTFWLDGWDLACFDACQGQEIEISFSLTSDVSLCDMQIGDSSEAINVTYTA